MPQLPIESVMPELLHGIHSCSRIILKAEPGAGKSTYLPLRLLREGMISGRIIMLEPRRLAARNIAHYIAAQLGEGIGERVGYRVRGESRVSAKTKLEIVTEGIMTQMIQSDPELTGIDLLIFDEFHERNIHADTSLAFSLEVQEALREDLKILIMSATLDHESLKTLLPDASYIQSEGRSYPVEYRYAPMRTNDRLVPAMARQIRLALANETGSVLAFLPGTGPILQLLDELGDIGGDTQVYPLYGQLDFRQQEQAISPCEPGRRKVVLATNIAETSLTIDGIRIVVDSGLERVAKFDTRTGITRLEQKRIAQSSAAQRAGRAGRIEEGICVRLYSEEKLSQQAMVPTPEILQADLSSLGLELARWGAGSAGDLKWMDLPPQRLLDQGYGLLRTLGLVDERRQLTALGKQVREIGSEPRLAAMLLKIKRDKPELLHTALALVAIIEERQRMGLDISQALYRLKQGGSSNKRIISRAGTLAGRIAKRFEPGRIVEDEAGLCLAIAYPDRIAKNRRGQAGQFVLANGHGGFMDDIESLSEEEYIVAVDLIRTHQESSRILLAARVDIQELMLTFPTLFSSVESVDWDEVRGELRAERQRRLGSLVIETEPLPKPNAERIGQALVNYIRRKGLGELNWRREDTELLERLRCGAEWFAEKSWPDLSNQSLLDNLETWLQPYMTGMCRAKELSGINLSQALLAYVGWPLNQEVDTLLPVYYQLPTGNRKRITYKCGAEPTLSVRVQEVFGEKSSPLIADGRKRIVLQLLSPAQRPIQITSDLAGFWAGSYKEVQKEMKGRYPKHPWPDDPANHVATTKTKRQLNS